MASVTVKTACDLMAWQRARDRNSPLWVEDPRQQLAYLASRRWGRLYAPDVIMGVYSPDELAEPGERFMGMVEEVGAPPPPPPPPPSLKLGQISERLGFTVTADFLGRLGFQPAATDKAAKLYHEADFGRICDAMIAHIRTVQHQQQAA